MEKKINRELQYNAKLSFDQSSSLNDILMYYYTPVIGVEAISLYNFILSEANNAYINNIYISQDRIISMLNLSEEALNKAITKLEIVGLMTVYVQPKSRNKITFVLNEPMLPTAFDKAEKLKSILIAAVGKENYEINNRYFNSNKFVKSDEEVSLTREFELVASNLRSVRDVNVSYNFDLLFDILAEMNIKYEKFWTNEFEKAIENSVVLYNISPLQVAEVIKELTQTKKKINIENYQSQCEIFYKVDSKVIEKMADEGQQTKEMKLNIMKDVDPITYIEISCGRKPNKVEINTINSFIQEYSFSKTIINMLVDYSLQVNGGDLNVNYITKIAETLIKNSITTDEEVRDFLKSTFKHNKKHQSVEISGDERIDF